MCRGEHSAVITRLMPNCLWSEWEWLERNWRDSFPFPRCPVNRECSWDKTRIEKKKLDVLLKLLYKVFSLLIIVFSCHFYLKYDDWLWLINPVIHEYIYCRDETYKLVNHSILLSYGFIWLQNSNLRGSWISLYGCWSHLSILWFLDPGGTIPVCLFYGFFYNYFYTIGQ